MRITVVGTGYVGLVTGTCLAEVGNDVVCHDIDQRKIDRLVGGEVPIYEPGLVELVKRNLADGRLRFTTKIDEAVAGAEVCFIAVGTPADHDGSADRRYVIEAVESVARAMSGPLVIAVKSTVPVGTCDRLRDVVADILRQRQKIFVFDVVSNPEFLKEGKAVEDFMRPDRIVVGAATDHGAQTMRSIYSVFIQNGHPFLLMTVRSSEMSKYAANVMLATRISLMNEIAQICERMGADIAEVRQGIGSDKRIGMAFLYAGIGYGGSCFPKDVKALARLAVECDCPGDILDAVDKVNRHQKVSLANRAITRFAGEVKGKVFAMWGLAFKPSTDDIREAPALSMIKRLTEAGASVRAYDPEAMANAGRELAANKSVVFAKSAYDALEGADALILATEWAQFKRPDFARLKTLLKQPIIFDGRNQYDPAEMARLGIEYHCIGRASA
jgi:UDPglucose 6-dehydrogenase